MKVRDVLPRDAIPSIDDPAFGPTYFGDPGDEVVVVDLGLEGVPARAYPIRVLNYHEIVNDRVGSRPVAVTWCPICGSAAVYDARAEGRDLTFGVSGKLADDALVMYDRETGSEWKQPTGEAIAGAFEGTALQAIAAPLVSWARFDAAHPDGVVLQPVRGTGEGGPSPGEAYDMTPYERYEAGDPFGLYGMRGEGERRSWDRPDIEAKTVVLGVQHGDEAIGYALPRVAAAGGVVTDTVDGLDVVVFSRRRSAPRVRGPRSRVRAGRRRHECVPRGRGDVGPDDRREHRRPAAGTASGYPALRVRLAGRTRPRRVLRVTRTTRSPSRTGVAEPCRHRRVRGGDSTISAEGDGRERRARIVALP